nr:Ig-like domain-containing protein [Micromonospora sp. DSM 115978]
MRGRLIAAAVAATLTAVVGMAPGATAGGEGDPLRGDVNGDGLIDRVTLGGAPAGAPGHCTVRVRHGLPGGGFAPAQSHTYPHPSRIETYCPGLGVIVDLGGDGVVELVLGWFPGPPAGLGFELLVLRDFRPAGGIRSRVYAPSGIETADFNADGRQDVYAHSDQGGGFISFLNTADGWLTPGPVVFELCDTFGFELADFHRTGGRGLLVWYPAGGCGDEPAGVSVVGHDGVRVDLERAGPPWVWDDRWTADALDANGDRIPDVRTDNQESGEVTHFIGAGDGTFAESPRAVFDRPTVSPTRPTRIHVLANDLATRQATVTITSQPKFGTVTVNPNRTITYTPQRPHDGGDRFTYRLDQDGKRHTTAVSMRFSG